MKRIILSLILALVGVGMYAQTDDGLVIVNNVVKKYTGNAESVVIPEGVTEIGESAFTGSITIKSISIPSTVTTIRAAAFAYCLNLTTINIPNSVTSIGYGAFAYCNNLTSLTIPSSVTNVSYEISNYNLVSLFMKKGTFHNESAINFEEEFNVTYYDYKTDDGLYINNNQVISYDMYSTTTDVVIPNTVTSIGSFAFAGSNITSISIPNSVTSIGTYAFASCLMLSSLTIPSSVTTVTTHYGEYSYLTYKHSPTIIPKNSFTNNSSLTREQITEIGVIETKDYVVDELTDDNIGTLAVGDYITCKGIKYQLTEEGLEVIGLENSLSGAVTIPSYVSCNGTKYSVTKVGGFRGRTDITSVDISEGITSIYGATFAECTGLETISLPSTLISVGKLYDSYTSAYISRYKLENRSSAIDITALFCIGIKLCDEKTDDCLIINNHAVIDYQGNSENVVIPEGVTSIAEMAFGHEIHKSIKSISIPSTVTFIGVLAFCACPSLTTINIPNSVTDLGIGAFEGCINLASLTIPSSVERINVSTGFPLEWIGVVFIKKGTFTNNSSISDIEDKLLIRYYDYKTDDGLWIDGTEVVMYAGDSQTVTIPNGITAIGVEAFAETAISSIKIPESVTSIGDGAFYGCSRLSNITLQSITPPNVSSDAFDASTYTSATLYVPYEGFEAYKSHEVWGKFKFIVPIGSYLHYYQNCKDESLVGTDYYYFTQDDSEVRMLNDDGHDYGDKHICIYCGKYESIKPDQDSDYIYIIANAHNLIWFRDYINSLTKRTEVHAIQINDIDLSGVCNETKGSWIPIGTASTSNWYGSYDGQNHKITGLYINTDQENQGLFGIVGYSDMKVDISNLSVTGDVTSKGKSAILCASIAGNIGNCETHGTLNASSGYVGGILGSYAATGTATYSISDCRNYASISCSSGSNVSGIVSSSKDKFTITRCVNYGNITSAGSAVAGIVARGYGNITYCANLGNITSTTSGQVAGITVNILGDCNINGCWSVNGKIYYRKSSSTSTLTDSYALSDIGTLEDVKAGKLAYLLSRTKVKGSPWGQTIGKDDYPVLDGPEVYQHHQYCEDVLLDKDEYIYYTNDDSEVRRINSGKHVSENCICKYCGKETHNFVNGECTLCHGHMKCSTPTYDPETGLDCTTAGVEYKISFSTWKATYQTLPDKLTLTIIATKPNYDPSEPLILTLDRLDLNNDGQLTPADYQKLADSIIGK